MSEQINELAAALAKAQSQIRGAEKDGKNPHFNSKYSTLEAVWDACREPLTTNGLAVVQTVEQRDGKSYLVTSLLHSSGQSKESYFPWCPPGGDQAKAQELGSYLTYLRRYGLAAMVGVTPTDDDGEGAMGRQKESQAPVKLTPPPPDDSEERAIHLQEGIDFCQEVPQLEAWVRSNETRINALPDRWKSKLRTAYKDKLATLKKIAAEVENG